MILTYHEIVAGRASYAYSISAEKLELHLAVLKELPADTEVTFDDGHISQYRYALPLLEKHGIRARFFITAGWTGVHAQYMDGGQLRELVSLGHEIQAHGWSHKMLTRCSPAELREELQHSRQALEDLLGAAVTAVSMPHGRWNDGVLERCAQAGYRDVYTSDVYISDAEAGGRKRMGVRVIGRSMITAGMTAQQLARLAAGEPQGRTLSRAKSAAKRLLKDVAGERLYHRAWTRLSGKSERLPGAERLERPIRVLQVISSGGYYGAESMLMNLATFLNREDCRNEIAVFRNTRNPHTEIAERAQQQGLAVAVIGCNGRLDGEAVREIRRAINRFGCDIVHTHGTKANLYGALAARPLGVPLVATCHLDWPDRSMRLYGNHLLDRLVLRSFRKVVAVSEPIARSLRRTGMPAGRVATVANGIDMAPWRAAAVGAKAAGGPWVIGVVGRLTPQKGHAYLLQAAPAILSRFPEAVFLLAGDGPERQNLQQLAGALGIAGSVRFAGAQTDMPAVYAAIDLLVLPSINEGMPMTLIEAMAAGRPVIASSVGDVPKLIRHGETGMLVEPANPAALEAAVTSLLADPQRRSALASEGQRYVCANFSAEDTARRYRRIYAEILGRPESAAPHASARRAAERRRDEPCI